MDDIDRFRLGGRKKQIISSRTGTQDIDRREDALLGKFAVKHQLHVAGSLKFLVNNIVHTAARLNQRGRQNRQAAALAYISRRTEEALRHMQRCRIQTT